MVNKQSLLQRILFNNSDKAVARQRYSPWVIDPQFHPMRNLKNALKAAYAKNGEAQTIIDIGCGNMPYRSLFPNSAYLGFDEYSTAMEVRKVNVEEPFFEKESDFIICSEVLEHSFRYDQVVDNIYKNLKSGKYAFVSVPFAYEIHGWDYHDYFRYTPESLEIIHEKFSSVEIKATNTYIATLIQKWNNVVFYIPVPYILKIPFFFAHNVCFYVVENVTRFLLWALRIPKESLLYKLIFSYPINFVCVAKK